jgi:transcriptional regulator with XRE-family HTH domain
VDPADLGMRIKRARERARMKQEDLAARLGVNIKTVDNWENGRSRPKSSLGAIEGILGPWGFRSDGSDDEGDSTTAEGVVREIIEVLHSRFSDSTKIGMIRDVIERDFRPANENDLHQRATG